jgi:hypothetical protein
MWSVKAEMKFNTPSIVSMVICIVTKRRVVVRGGCQRFRRTGCLHRHGAVWNRCEIGCLNRVKVKQSRYRPWQALRVPGGWGSQILRQSAHEGGRVVSPTHRPSLPQENISGTHVRGWVDPRAIVRPEGLCQWKITMTIGNQSRDLPVCSAVSQPLRHRVPGLNSVPAARLLTQDRTCGCRRASRNRVLSDCPYSSAVTLSYWKDRIKKGCCTISCKYNLFCLSAWPVNKKASLSADN